MNLIDWKKVADFKTGIAWHITEIFYSPLTGTLLQTRDRIND